MLKCFYIIINLLSGAGQWMETSSFAPHGVVLGLDHTDGVIVPGLGHPAHHDHGVLIGVVLQNVIMVNITITATCKYYVPVISGV